MLQILKIVLRKHYIGFVQSYTYYNDIDCSMSSDTIALLTYKLSHCAVGCLN